MCHEASLKNYSSDIQTIRSGNAFSVIYAYCVFLRSNTIFKEIYCHRRDFVHFQNFNDLSVWRTVKGFMVIHPNFAEISTFLVIFRIILFVNIWSLQPLWTSSACLRFQGKVVVFIEKKVSVL